MIHRGKARAVQGSPEALGEARRRLYEVYALVRAALPADARHEQVCEILEKLASTTYREADEDQADMKRLWESPDIERRGDLGI
jgi:hypothetical protein